MTKKNKITALSAAVEAIVRPKRWKKPSKELDGYTNSFEIMALNDSFSRKLAKKQAMFARVSYGGALVISPMISSTYFFDQNQEKPPKQDHAKTPRKRE